MEATVFTGYIVLGLALWGIFRLRAEAQVRLWGWMTLIFAILSLGPLLHIGGDFVFGVGPIRFAIPLPYIIMHYLPLFKGARVPARFDIVVSLGLAVLNAYALRSLLRLKTRVWPVAAGVALLISLEYLRLPYPTSPVEIPPIYHRIARDDRDVAVMEVPLGWRTGWGITGRSFDVQQLFQIVHGKPLIGGFASRVAQSRLDAMEALPLAKSLLALQEEVEVPLPPTAGRRDEIRRQLVELLEHLPDFAAEYAKGDASVRNFLTPPATTAAKGSPRPADIEKDQRSVLQLVEQTRLGYVIVHPPYTGHAPLLNYLTALRPLKKFYDQDGIVGFRVTEATD